MTQRVVMASIQSARSAIIVTGLGVHVIVAATKLRLLVRGVVDKGRSRWIMTTTCHWTMMLHFVRGCVERVTEMLGDGIAFMGHIKCFAASVK